MIGAIFLRLFKNPIYLMGKTGQMLENAILYS